MKHETYTPDDPVEQVDLRLQRCHHRCLVSLLAPRGYLRSHVHRSRPGRLQALSALDRQSTRSSNASRAARTSPEVHDISFAHTGSASDDNISECLDIAAADNDCCSISSFGHMLVGSCPTPRRAEWISCTVAYAGLKVGFAPPQVGDAGTGILSPISVASTYARTRGDPSRDSPGPSLRRVEP